MKKTPEYITCINCGQKAIIIYNPTTGERAGYHCPCQEPHRDTSEDIKPNGASWLLTDEKPLSKKKV